MARQESPVDPADGPLQALAHELRKLRAEAGSPTYRALARRTGYSPSTLSEAANGKRKPTLDVLLAYVGALHGDPDDWRRRWEALEDPPAPGPHAQPSETHPRRPAEAHPPRPADAHPPRPADAHPPRPADAHPPRPAEAHTERPPVARPSTTPGTEPIEKTESQPPGTPGTEPLGKAEAQPPEAPRAEPPEKAAAPGRASRRLLAAGGIGLVALAAGAVAVRAAHHPAPKRTTEAAATAPGCPPADKSATFFARTYGSGTTIRQGPARTEQPISRVPAGCTVGLTGYCAGEPIIDSTAYTPDVRWFMVAGGGVLSSATVHGNPPPGMPLGHCAGERPLPTAITLHVAEDNLTAEGHHVEVVGYAAFYDGSWHQIGLTGPGRGDFAVRWRPVPGTVAAVACLGGQSPTGVTDLRAYPAGGGRRLTEAERNAAGQVACLYPTAE